MELDKYLDKLDCLCKDILSLWVQDYKMKEIARELQFRDEAQARKKKYKCLEKLKRIKGKG